MQKEESKLQEAECSNYDDGYVYFSAIASYLLHVTTLMVLYTKIKGQA